jgi:hypothetical protein
MFPLSLWIFEIFTDTTSFYGRDVGSSSRSLSAGMGTDPTALAIYVSTIGYGTGSLMNGVVRDTRQDCVDSTKTQSKLLSI